MTTVGWGILKERSLMGGVVLLQRMVFDYCRLGNPEGAKFNGGSGITTEDVDYCRLGNPEGAKFNGGSGITTEDDI